MIGVFYACASFHDGQGNEIYRVTSRDLQNLIYDIPEGIRQDPLFAWMRKDGTLVVHDTVEKAKKEMDDPLAVHNADGTLAGPKADEAPAEAKATELKPAAKGTKAKAEEKGQK